MATMEQPSLDGGMFTGLEDGEPEERQTDEIMLRVIYNRHQGDAEMPANEWGFRLRLGGVDVDEVEIIEPTHQVPLRPRSEPRSP